MNSLKFDRDVFEEGGRFLGAVFSSNERLYGPVGAMGAPLIQPIIQPPAAGEVTQDQYLSLKELGNSLGALLCDNPNDEFSLKLYSYGGRFFSTLLPFKQLTLYKGATGETGSDATDFFSALNPFQDNNGFSSLFMLALIGVAGYFLITSMDEPKRVTLARPRPIDWDAKWSTGKSNGYEVEWA